MPMPCKINREKTEVWHTCTVVHCTGLSWCHKYHNINSNNKNEKWVKVYSSIFIKVAHEIRPEEHAHKTFKKCFSLPLGLLCEKN